MSKLLAQYPDLYHHMVHHQILTPIGKTDCVDEQFAPVFFWDGELSAQVQRVVA